MQRPPRCRGDAQAGKVSYGHTDTHKHPHTPRLLGLLGMLPHPTDLPGRNSHRQHHFGHGSPPLPVCPRNFLLVFQLYNPSLKPSNLNTLLYLPTPKGPPRPHQLKQLTPR